MLLGISTKLIMMTKSREVHGGEPDDLLNCCITKSGSHAATLITGNSSTLFVPQLKQFDQQVL